MFLKRKSLLNEIKKNENYKILKKIKMKKLKEKNKKYKDRGKN
jgi:hypothetical protein